MDQKRVDYKGEDRPVEKKKKKPQQHIVPFDKVFPPDPHEEKEDVRPIEKRKKPKKSFRMRLR